MANFRPAGMSDDDSDSDYDFYEKPIRKYQPTPSQHSVRKRIEIDLQSAIINGKLDEVDKIMTSELNNDVNTRLDSGWTTLMHACFHAQEKIVQLLLDRGADPNLQSDSVTPIMLTCSNSSANNDAMYNIISTLISKGSLLNIGDKYGQTPLMRAISSGRVAVVYKLLESGVNIEMRDQQGWTAVFWAAHHNQPEILEMLIGHSARLTEVDRSGRTPLDIAYAHDYQNIVEMFEAKLKPDTEEENGRIFISPQISSWHDYYPGINDGEPITYSSEIPHLLYGMNLDRLAPVFQSANCDLRTFLLLEDKDLDTLGIDMPYERQRLKLGLKCFHTKGWKLNAVAGLYARKSDDYSVLDCVTALGSHLQQIYILEATLQYALRNYKKARNQLKFEPPDSPLLTRLKAVSKNILVNINSIRREIYSMKTALTKISRNNPPPADYIREKSEKSVRETAIHYISEAVMIGSVALLAYTLLPKR